MDNQAPDTLPSVELPRPQEEQAAQEYTAQVDTKTEQVTTQQLERGSATAVMPPVDNDGQSQAVPQAVPAALQPHEAPPAGVPGITVTPQIADDTDLIEKEWVDRAKQIVEHTRHDPHQQNREMNLMKADYLKKRYNKDIKLDE